MPDMILRDFWKGVVGAFGTLLAETQRGCKSFMQKMEWDRDRYLNYACFCFINSIPPPRTFEESSSLIYTPQDTLLKHRAEGYGACRKGVSTPNACAFINQFSRF